MELRQQCSIGKGLLVQFTKDMSQTLEKYFETYASKGVVNMEANHQGLWLINPANGSRQFLGKATLNGQSTIQF